VGIKADRIGQTDPVETVPATIGQPEEPAVGGVGMEPQAFPARGGGQLGQRVDRPGLGGARGTDDEERPQAGGYRPARAP
jgi:hypothetical protein